jgi:hypothetical protein
MGMYDKNTGNFKGKNKNKKGKKKLSNEYIILCI